MSNAISANRVGLNHKGFHKTFGNYTFIYISLDIYTYINMKRSLTVINPLKAQGTDE
jgi:hypothetical protein